MKKLIFILICAINYGVYAQPANDVCSGATTIPTDGTCISSGNRNAGDHWIGTVGCQSGNHNEVWFTFVATGNNTDITVTQGTMTGDIEVVVVESSNPPCGGLGYMGSGCSPGPSSVTTLTNLVIGATYYITVNGTGADGSFTICNLNYSPPPTPGQDCPNAFSLCDNSGFSVGTISDGAGNIFGNSSAEDVSVNSCFGGDERQSQWYTFTVDEAGDLEFQIAPNSFTDDYDWAVYDITTSGCIIAPETPLACNWSFCSGMTGLTSDVTQFTGALSGADYEFGNPAGAGSCDGAPGGPDNGNGSSQWENQINLIAGNTYAILIDNFSTSNSGFDFFWTGTDAQIGPDATFSAALDASCYTVSLNRLTNYVGPNMSYNWSFGDGTTSTDPIPSAHTYGSIGLFTITLEVTDAIGCISTFSTVVDVGCILLSSRIEEFSGSFVETHNALSLEMASNKDFSHFIVQRSLDGSNWNDAGEVSANGEEGDLNYAFNDYNYYLNSNNYYRLKMFNAAGEVTFSEVIVIENKEYAHGGLFVHNIYPTPFTDQLTIEIESDRMQSLKFMLFDLLGHKVIDRKISVNQNINKLELDLESIEAGIYLLQIATNDDVISLQRKIVKK